MESSRASTSRPDILLMLLGWIWTGARVRDSSLWAWSDRWMDVATFEQTLCHCSAIEVESEFLSLGMKGVQDA